MVSIDKAVIAKLVKGGEKYEILVDPDAALAFKHGKEMDVSDLVATPDVYHDQATGDKVSPSDLNSVFGSNDLLKIAEKIIKDGDVQLTTEQRHKMLEDLKKKVSYAIAREGVNPQTKIPHPQDRIVRAMDEAKVKLVLGRGIGDQIEETIKAIQRILPISMEKVKISVKLPVQYAGAGVAIVHRFGKPVSESWGGDGSYTCVMDVSGGVKAELIDKLGSMAHGQAEVNDLK